MAKFNALVSGIVVKPEDMTITLNMETPIDVQAWLEVSELAAEKQPVGAQVSGEGDRSIVTLDVVKLKDGKAQVVLMCRTNLAVLHYWAGYVSDEDLWMVEITRIQMNLPMGDDEKGTITLSSPGCEPVTMTNEQFSRASDRIMAGRV